MEENTHPELDESPFLNEDLSSIYRGITGSLNWLLTLGRFDIAYATSTLARFNMQPREGHLISARRILGYLKKFGHGKMVFGTGYIDRQKQP